MQTLIKSIFPHVMAPCFLQRLHAIQLKTHKAAVKTLFPDGSKFTTKQDICPSIDTAALVTPLLFECLHIAFFTFDVSLLLVLPIKVAIPCIVAMSEVLFRFVQSSFLLTCRTYQGLSIQNTQVQLNVASYSIPLLL